MMIGLEPTFDEHLENLVAVFREVRRVLRPDGTCWLNYGDAYAGSGKGKGGEGKQRSNRGACIDHHPGWRAGTWKPKDLMLMPARVALALQEDGWWVRSEVVWHKPNPMPESVRDRPTAAHEKVFLLSRSARYFYDADAVRTVGAPPRKRLAGGRNRDSSRNDRESLLRYDCTNRSGRNLRNVLTVTPRPFKGSHFATYPPQLIEPFILAGTSRHGACAECGAPWRRALAGAVPAPGRGSGNLTAGSAGQVGDPRDTHRARSIPWEPTHSETVGWRPTCGCGVEQVRPCVVLDPFAGAGTTGLVADSLGCDALLVEISPEYARMAERRLVGAAPLFADVVVEE